MPVLKNQEHMLPIGGDAGVKKKAPLHGNIVKTMMIGNTTIHFCDDCIVETEEEVDQVLERFHAAGWAIIEDLVARGESV